MKSYKVKPVVTACAMAMVISAAPALADKSENKFSDTWSEAALETTYTLNRQLNPFDIDTSVHEGVATLKGTVEDQAEKELAEALALSVDGIKEVKNELKIDPGAAGKNTGSDMKDGNSGFIQKVEDANLTAKVKSQLLWNGSTSGMSINVDTQNGKVRLTGSVASETESELAEQIARNTEDVRGVENRLKVNGKDASLGDKTAREVRQVSETVSDSWITAKVKSVLIYNRNIDGMDIDVETRNGIVTLTGEVDSEFERKQAISVAKAIKGVKDVKADFAGS